MRCLRSVVDKIVELEVPTRPYGHRGRKDAKRFKDSKSVTKVELVWSKEKLAQERLLPDKKYLKDWEKRHLIKTKGKIGLLRPGMLVANSEAVSLIYASFGEWDELEVDGLVEIDDSEIFDKTKSKLQTNSTSKPVQVESFQDNRTITVAPINKQKVSTTSKDKVTTRGHPTTTANQS